MDAKLKAQFADYLCSELGRRPGTVKQYLWRLDYVERLLDKAVQDITPTDLRTFKRDTTLRRETVKNISRSGQTVSRLGGARGPLG